MSQEILPLAVWESGTNNNSIPANDNALRVEVALKEAISIADSEPGSPSERDLHIVGTSWGGFTTNNAVIYLGGTWYEFEAFDGWFKTIAGDLYNFDGSDWKLVTSGGGGIPDAPSDGNLYGRKDGAWAEVTGGGGGGGANAPLTPPPQTGWSWVNQGGASLTINPSFVRIQGGASGTGLNLRGVFLPIPAAPFSITFALRITRVHKQFQSGGVALRESASGRIIIVSDLSGTTVSGRVLQLAKLNSPTVFSADYRALGFAPGDLVWLRVTDDGTDRKVFFSQTGHQWLEYHSVANTDFIVPDQVGVVLNSENQSAPNFSPIVDLVSYLVE